MCRNLHFRRRLCRFSHITSPQPWWHSWAVDSALPLTWDLVRGHRLRRISGADVGLLPEALWQDRSLVKTYGPRGTVHVFAATELALWTAATRAMPAKGSRQPPPGTAAMDPTPEQADQLRAAVRSAASSSELTHAELGAAIAAECGPWVDTTAIQAFNAAGRTGEWPSTKQSPLACCVSVGHKATGSRSYEPTNGFRTALLRRGRTRTRWSVKPLPYTSKSQGTTWRRTVQPHIRSSDNGWPYLPGGQGRCTPRSGANSFRWTSRATAPGFWACRTRHGRSFARGTGRQFLCGPLPVLLVDGVVNGVWTLRRERSVEQVRVEVFGRVTGGLRKRLDEEVARLAEVLGRDLALSIGPAAIAAHL